MKQKFIKAYMEVAKTFARLSSAKRLQVGAVVVKDDRIMPSGWDNVCEHEGKTKSEVLHAESNAIAKLAGSHESGKNATLLCTHAPCIECAKLIYQSGISTVYYENSYRSIDGIQFLIKSNVKVVKND
jgi:dCMP deaminase